MRTSKLSRRPRLVYALSASIVVTGGGCSGGQADTVPLSPQIESVAPDLAVVVSRGAVRVAQRALSLPTGSFLVLDVGQKRLLELVSGEAAKVVLRDGAGPYELRNPVGVFPWVADIIAVVDSPHRLIVLSPEAVPGRESVVPLPEPTARLRAAGPRGHLFFEVLDRARGADGESRIVLTVTNEAGQELGTLVDLQGPRWAQTENRRSGPGRVTSVSVEVPVPGSPQDDWTLFGPGALVVLRVSDYSVARYALSGAALQSGPATPYDPRPFDAVGDAQHRALRALGVSTNPPSHHPPFGRGSAQVWLDRGETWVAREDLTGAGFYDVFDSSGVRTGSFRFMNECRVIGFTPAGVLVAEASADGFDSIVLFPPGFRER